MSGRISPATLRKTTRASSACWRRCSADAGSRYSAWLALFDDAVEPAAASRAAAARRDGWSLVRWPIARRSRRGCSRESRRFARELGDLRPVSEGARRPRRRAELQPGGAVAARVGRHRPDGGRTRHQEPGDGRAVVRPRGATDDDARRRGSTVHDPDPRVHRGRGRRCSRAGGLVAFPTETVYGLGAHALDAAAVAGIFAAKGRPATDPVIVHLATRLSSRRWRATCHTRQRSRRRFLARRADADRDKAAGGARRRHRGPGDRRRARARRIRWRSALLATSAIPVAAPSANRFSRPSPTTAEHVLADLDGRDRPGPRRRTDVDRRRIDDPRSHRVAAARPTAGRGVARRASRASCRTSQRTTIAERAPAATGAGPAAAPLRAACEADVLSGRRRSRRIEDGARCPTAPRPVASRVGILAPEEDLIALAPRLAPRPQRALIVTARCGSAATTTPRPRSLRSAPRRSTPNAWTSCSPARRKAGSLGRGRRSSVARRRRPRRRACATESAKSRDRHTSQMALQTTGSS